MSTLTWLGHSTVTIDIDGTRVVTDPLLRRRVAHLRRRTPVETPLRVDGILVSHAHYDHLDLPSLTRLDRALPVVVPRGIGRLVRRRGFTNVVEVAPGDDVRIGDLRITATPAVHSGSRHPFAAAAPALGYVVAGSASVYFAGDTDLFAGMESIGPVDAALLPVSGWGARLPAGHLDPQRAADALRLLRPRLAIPIHWGTYRTPFAAAPSDEPARAFARAAAERAPSVVVRVLPLGGSCQIDAPASPPSDDAAAVATRLPRQP